MKKRLASALLCIILVICMIPFSAFSEGKELPFEDVKPENWFYEAVCSVYESGFMNGLSDKLFGPGKSMTRAQFVTIISRISGENVTGLETQGRFFDTALGKYYSDALGWCVKNGIINGYPDGTFCPDKPILRQEFAAVFVRYLEYKGIEIEGEDVASPFADTDTFPGFAKDAIESMRLTGLVKGDKNGRFNPKNNMSRAEIAQVLTRLMPYVKGNVIVSDGKSDYVIVCSEENMSAAERISWQIEKVTGVKLEIVSDEVPESEHEIVLGETGRESGIDTAGLEGDGYEIKTVGEKYFIDGGSPEGIYLGAAALLKSYLGGEKTYMFEEGIDRRVPSEYPVKTISINGRDISEYSIVYPEDASRSVMTGAGDIQKYIKKACGAELPLTSERKSPAIVIDQTTVEIDGSYNNNEENYTVKSSGDDIIITGSPVRGALWGCYGFLDDVVGWNFLTPKVDYIRPCEKVEISDVDITYAPYFEYCENLWGWDGKDESFYAKKKLNGNTSSEEYGGGIHYTGGGCHTFMTLTDGEYDQSTQPCLNDEEIYQKMLGNVLKLLEANPDARVISVSQNDNPHYCECEKCTAVAEEEGAQSGNIIRFVNRIADAVKDAGYDRVAIHTFAYQYSVEACKTKPRDNVIVQYCIMGGCYIHNFEDENCRLDKGDHCNSGFIKGWDKICDRIWIWDYCTHFGNYLDPSFNYRYEVACGHARFYYENGVSGIFNEGPYNTRVRSGEFGELKNYLFAEAMTDPLMSEEKFNELLDIFLEGYYGPEAAPFMKEYIEIMLKDNICDDWLNLRNVHPGSRAVRFKKSFDTLDELFDSAMMSSDTFYEWECLYIDRMQLSYMELNYLFDYSYKKADKEGKAAIREQMFELSKAMDKYGMRISEGIGSPGYESSDEIKKAPYEWRR